MGWRRARSWFTAALGVSLSFSALGRASELTAEERVDKLRDQAFAAASAGRFTEAADRFREAWELGHEFIDICNVGRAEMDLGRWREAAEPLEICMKVMPEDQKPTFGERFGRFQKEVRAKVGVLSITANVQGAEVFVDDKLVGKLPGPIFVDPGWHKVQVRACGYQDGDRAFQVAAGELMKWDVELKPSALACAPTEREQLPPKPQTAREPGPLAQTASRKAPLAHPSPVVPNGPSAVLVVTGTGLAMSGAAATIGGFVTAAGASEKAATIKNALKEEHGDHACSSRANLAYCTQIELIEEKAYALTWVGVGGLAVTGVGAALLAYEFMRTYSPTGKPSTQAAVMVRPGMGALIIRGNF